MALKPCKECSKEVSSEASICPHCGKRLRMHGFVYFIWVVVGFFGFVLVVSAMMAASQ